MLDPLSDLIVFNQLLSREYYYYAAAVAGILLLHWRFCVLYCALTPVASRRGASAMYWPLLLLPNWPRRRAWR